MNYVCFSCGTDKISGYVKEELEDDVIVKHYCSTCLKSLETEQYENDEEGDEEEDIEEEGTAEGENDTGEETEEAGREPVSPYVNPNPTTPPPPPTPGGGQPSVNPQPNNPGFGNL